MVRVPLLTQLGYTPDLNLHKAWGQALFEDGLERVTEMPNSPVNYFPNYALPLYLFKGIYAFFTSVLHGSDPTGSILLTVLLKLPATFADLVCGLLLYLWSARWVSGKRRLIAPALYLLNPGVIFDSAVWGQIDGLHATLVFAAFMLWFAGKKTGAWVVFFAALMTKVHSVVFLPLILALALFDDGVRGFVRRRLPAIIAVFSIAVLPYLLALGPARLLLGSAGSVSKYPFLTLNAFNIWWPFARIVGGLARDDQGPFPMVYVGFAVFAFAAILILDSWRRDRSEKRTIIAAALIAFAFYMFPTEIHERYLFPFFPFAALVAAWDPRWRKIVPVLAIGFLVDLFFASEAVIFPTAPIQLRDVMQVVDPWFLVNLICFFALLAPYLENRPRQIEIGSPSPAVGRDPAYLDFQVAERDTLPDASVRK
jgi:hypothetical protein